jgi:tetratricopeptide (TPR) repeat protein
MTEPVDTIESGTILEVDTDDELTTANLDGRRLSRGQSSHSPSDQTTDWVFLLSNLNTSTQPLDEPPATEPAPSGMAEHTAAPRMRPTIGARLASGLKRSALLVLVAALAAGALAAGAYAVYSTSWISSPPPPATAPAPQPPEKAVAPAAPPAPAGGNAGGAPDAGSAREQGTELYTSGKYEEAIGVLESSISAGGGDAVTYYQLGLAYLAVAGREHALEDAELAFRTAISLQPSWAPPHQMLAESLLRRGFFNEAIAPANEAITLDPSQAEAWLTLGRAHKGAGQDSEAARAFEEAARLAPK